MKKILFIEDEAALQEAFGEVLKQKKYKVTSALNGGIGLRLAKSEKPDLILLDLVLPEMSGLEVLEKLKKDQETKDIPVIVLTNLERVAEVDKAIELGANTYLVKMQYKLDEIIGKIEKIIK